MAAISNRLACVTADGLIQIVDGAGGHLNWMGGSEHWYAWPVWSPDGKSVAFSGTSSGFNGNRRVGLYSMGVDQTSPRPRTLYANQPGTDAIAELTPHYTVWSPDGRRQAFIAQTWGGGLTLFTRLSARHGKPRRLLSGAPLYASWSPDSRYLLIHSGADYHQVDTGRRLQVTRLPNQSRQPSAPSWSPVTGQMALLLEMTEGVQTLVVADPDGGNVGLLGSNQGASAFSWRPEQPSIAVARHEGNEAQMYQGVWLIDVASGTEEQIISDPVIAFFWSPDGRQLAYVTPVEIESGWVRWSVLNLETGRTVDLTPFRPTVNFWTLLRFFDQYSQSARVWSADGRQLVMAGTLDSADDSSDEPAVYAQPADRSEEPRLIVEGTLGVWAPV